MIVYNINKNISEVYLGDNSISEVYIGANKVFPSEEPPTPVFGGKYKFTLTDSSVVSAKCDSSTTLTLGYTMPYYQTLSAVEFGECLLTLGNQVFQSFPNLVSVNLSGGITTIGQQSFSRCSGLTSVVIPSNVKTIGGYAFQECPLSSITLEEGVSTIGGGAFTYANISSISIPSSVTNIGNYSLMGCPNLTNIVVNPSNTVYDSRNNCNAIIETATNKLIQGCKTTIIPSDIQMIGDYAFQNCSGLTSVTIPSGVTSIGSYAFSFCSDLTSIAVPDSVTSIGLYCFVDCQNLVSATIGSGVTLIDNYAFYNCSNLTSITINATTPPRLYQYNYAFDNTNNCPIYVPSESVEAYKTAQYWSEYASRLQPIP